MEDVDTTWDGPITELVHMHKAIRLELANLEYAANSLKPGEFETVRVIASRFDFLWGMVQDHSKAEDQILFPALTQRLESIGRKINDLSSPYSTDHKCEDKFFDDINQLLACIRASADLSQRAQLVAQVVHKLVVLFNSLTFHLSKEEQELLPLMREHFTREEQLRIANQVTRSVPRAWMKQAASTVRVVHPVDIIVVIHEAIRRELKSLEQASKDLDPFDDNAVSEISERFQLLWTVVRDHSAGEDTIFFPALDEKLREKGDFNLSRSFTMDHDCERELFDELRNLLHRTVDVTDPRERNLLVEQVKIRASTIHQTLTLHLSKEEEELWPQLQSVFSLDEQEILMGRIIGHRPSAMLEQMLPWMVQALTASERTNMMHHIRNITKGTMFEKWLSCWWAGEGYWSSGPQARDQRDVPVPDHMCYQMIPCDYSGCNGDVIPTQAQIEASIRSIARDASLDPQQKTAKIQEIMTLRWRASSAAQAANRTASSSEATPTYSDAAAGIMGCAHYKRACKLKAACCNKLFTCRLCHDDASDHTMDRYATKEMMCMRCGTLQAVGQACFSDVCNGRPLARYYCHICKFWDDDPHKDVYHCPFCNICRVGKGLGVDFFHCMKCNACMSMALSNHRCLENSLENNCPICHSFMFTSTSQVKVLRCGHYMHTACFRRHIQSHYTCPICCKSLADMSSLFAQLDAVVAAERLPPEYANRVSDILCNDCESRSSVPFHFLYHKCPSCSSYNTRRLR